MYVDKVLKRLAKQPDLVIAVCSFLLILISTLYPFNFSLQEDSFLNQLLGSLKQPSNLVDQIVNVLLFIPLGFSLNWLLTKRSNLRWIPAFAIALFISFSFSLSIELLQTFLPARTSSLSDVLTNTAGGGFGYLSFNWWKGGLKRRIYDFFQLSLQKLTVQQLTIGFISYLLLVFLVTVGSQNIVNLDRWNTTFPLLIGNEKTGDRPWKGSIFELAIADRAVSEKTALQILEKNRISDILGSSLLTEYSFTGKEPYADIKGRSPDLIGRGTIQNSPSNRGISLSPQGWLETGGAAKFINEHIQRTSQFTLSLIVATAEQVQNGPARIVSLSQDPFNRNLTIGQEGQDLAIRLRTPFSGQNGAHPELYIEKVFADTIAHHIIITYGSSILRVYVDNIQHLQTFELTPDATLLSYILPPKIHQGKVVEIFHALLIFAPLAFLLALITTFVRGNFIFYCLLTVGGVLLPALLLEFFWISRSHQSIRAGNLLLDIAVFLTTFLAVKLLIKWSLANLVERSFAKTGNNL
jgi:glycopeptide antibiotics resistance protein